VCGTTYSVVIMFAPTCCKVVMCSFACGKFRDNKLTLLYIADGIYWTEEL